MKNILALLLTLCLLCTGLMGCAAQEPAPEAEPSPSPSPEPEALPSQEPIVIPTVDYESLYALHEPEELVMTVNGNDIHWNEYFYMLVTACEEMAYQFNTMASYYGMAMSWDTPIGEDPAQTYASLIPATVESNLHQLMTIKGFAAENKVELSPESKEGIAAQLEAAIANYGGEEGSEEAFNAYLESNWLPRSLYDEINRINYLYQDGFRQTYGADAERVSDADALAWLEEGGYMACDHILLMTIDSSTGQSLEEAKVQEIQKKAGELAQELAAIEDREELLKRFRELKDEYTEDTGAAHYPDGYTFTTGKMVPEFENGCRELEEYQVSDPIQSSYGYHIILRLPLDPDGIIEFSSQGTPLNARKLSANQAYADALSAYAQKVKITPAEGFEVPDILDYLQ